MQYAVVEIGGKQYKVKVGDILAVDKQDAVKDSISFEKVLLYVADDGHVVFGKPYIDDAKVTGKVLGTSKGPKLRVARFTAKSRHRRVIGFRPSVTEVEIREIKVSPRSKQQAAIG